MKERCEILTVLPYRSKQFDDFSIGKNILIPEIRYAGRTGLTKMVDYLPKTEAQLASFSICIARSYPRTIAKEVSRIRPTIA